MPSTMVEIGVAMNRLTTSMPAPRGVDASKAFAAYTSALAIYDLADIEEGITRFLRGDCDEKISLKWYPRPPELARIVASVRAERSLEAEKAKRAERLAAERREVAEGMALAKKTPEQIARADALIAKYRRGEPIATTAEPPSSFKAGHWKDRAVPGPVRRKTQREIDAEIEAEARRIRKEYGMTVEKLAAVPDRDKLPPGMSSLHAAAPGIPEPQSFAELSDEEIERKFGGAGT